MRTTFTLTLLLIIDMIVVLVIGAGTLPAKVVMKTMPRQLQEATKEHPNPPIWKMVIGYGTYLICILTALGVFIFAGYDAVKQDMGFVGIFLRYMIMFFGFKVFDIIALDWWLITKSQFFQHFFPETKGNIGYQSFGFNKKEQLAQILAFPIVSAVIAGICVWIK